MYKCNFPYFILLMYWETARRGNLEDKTCMVESTSRANLVRFVGTIAFDRKIERIERMERMER